MTTNHESTRRSAPSSAADVPTNSGSTSWDRTGVDDDHRDLTTFLESVAATETIQSAMSLAVSRMQLRPGDRVLDAGCGSGVFIPAIAEPIGPRGLVVGLDHAWSFLATAKERPTTASSGRGEFARGDVHRLPFADGVFDAAHTERVLMHVERPDAVIAELRRVVKPGGWVVCVEPDIAGMRVDHIDPGAMRALVDGFCRTIRNPAMGLELSRRFRAAGLVERSIEALTEIEHDYPPDGRIYYGRASELMVAEGRLTAERGRAAVSWLAEAGDSGSFTTYSSLFVAAGRAPEG